MSGCEKKIERTNALRELCPGDLSGLSAKARQGGRDYAFAWMKAFEVMGTAGLHDFEEMAFKETLPHIEPLKNGTPAEKTDEDDDPVMRNRKRPASSSKGAAPLAKKLAVGEMHQPQPSCAGKE